MNWMIEIGNIPEQTIEVGADSSTGRDLSSGLGASQTVQLLAVTALTNVHTLHTHNSGFFLDFRSLGRLQARQRLACPGFSRVQLLQIQHSSTSSSSPSLLLSWKAFTTSLVISWKSPSRLWLPGVVGSGLDAWKPWRGSKASQVKSRCTIKARGFEKLSIKLVSAGPSLFYERELGNSREFCII